MLYYDKNLISIIMPMYNAEKYLGDSINSVLNQTYSNWELIIIDDCSQDSSKQIADQYRQTDDRIKIICMDRNSGVAKARNKGIEHAHGRYIAFLDSDDIWLPEKLAHQIAFMNKKNATISYTQYRHFTNDIKECGDLIDAKETMNYAELLKGNSIGCLTVMVDRFHIPDIYMPSNRHEDYITWLEIVKKAGNAYGLREDLARYRKNYNSLSGNKLKSLSWTWDVYRKSQQLSLAKSSYYFCHYVLKGFKKHF